MQFASYIFLSWKKIVFYLLDNFKHLRRLKSKTNKRKKKGVKKKKAIKKNKNRY